MSDKYVVFAARHRELDYFSFMRFNEHLVHADVAETMRPMIATSYSVAVEDVRVVGAGFVRDTLLGVECYGESDSLNIKSRGEKDSFVLNWHGSTFIDDVDDDEESEGCEAGADTKAAHEKVEAKD